jgi:hypothetical protein
MLVDATREISARRKEFTQAHECAHDVEARLDSATGVQDGGRHERAMLGKGERGAAQPHFGPGIGHHDL